MAKIFLDAGHNYSSGDTGAVGNGLKEQNVTWEITSRVAKLLRNAGQVAIESRPFLITNVGNSVPSSVNGRISAANISNSDIVVCIHANAASDKTANGSEIWICGIGGRTEKLANNIMPQLLKSIGTLNRGIKVNPTAYGILRDTKAPAVLIETAFITNSEDAKKLVQYDVVANAIFTGIMNYFGIAIPAPVAPIVKIDPPVITHGYSQVMTPPSNPAPAPVKPQFIAGISKVKMTGKKYATGQNIPLWAKLRTYDVLQVKTTMILVGIGKAATGWIWTSECKKL
jgi:N-acetylmuramoyl-L-alanine amidase